MIVRLTTAFLMSLLLLAGAAHAEGPVYSYSTSDLNFDEVKDNVKMAITGRGVNIANELHASEMLNRTGPDLGFAHPVFKRAETIEFCSAVISLRLVESNPDNVVMCPFTISIYQLNNDEGVIHAAFRVPVGFEESAEQYAEVADFISGIVKEAMEID
ncbi:MAG: hypothetical protein H6926_02885 [Chromatiales bacterium]|nr:hypothetical protein [Gammaproteobacteria bacterium]MCP5352120.1 hypothetical protein [Chromatiales bacterium]